MVTVRTGAAVAGGAVDTAVWCTVLCLVVVVVEVLVAASVSGVVVVTAGTATVGTLSVAGAVSVDGAVCVASGVACCASKGVEESARAAAIAVAPSRAWSLCLVIVVKKPPFSLSGASVIGGLLGNGAQMTRARLTSKGDAQAADRVGSGD